MDARLVTFGAYLFGLVLVYLIARAVLLPVRLLVRLALSAVVGGLALAAVNVAGTQLGLHVALNPFTALVTGVLGVPGVLLLVATQVFLSA